ncbi:metalloregulator ArsR/SmtB family transcription factor [Asticcacaulis sp.]|uniref:metalloregulator ArsR/SmtB family transcription factor n=1 Tax=Asticcacaulis sp. TaxID=1872648 RepID=UPI002CE5D728|nr:metalloregulator ArsR/SmtB family transcription factor [Asticcacaulis sp.]HTM81682.1 metalloregulator ArsR/SmtB family transcription factor [Asticcacaulis sp.]
MRAIQAAKIFAAMASEPRLKILAYLSKATMTAGEIAERFDMAKPSLSKHLSILENAGLVSSVKKGKFIHYSIMEAHIVNSLDGYLQEVCPTRKPLREESAAKAKGEAKD